MKTQVAKPLMLATLVALSCLWGGAAVQAATPVVHATVEGSLAPGVYGRIDIGNSPAPVVIYPQPLIITAPTIGIQQQPIYLHVPPGHAKNWDKHCRRYNACGQPVYFVQDNWYNQQYVPQFQQGGRYEHREDQRGYGRDDNKDRGDRKDRDDNDNDNDNGRGHGRGNGKGRGRD